MLRAPEKTSLLEIPLPVLLNILHFLYGTQLTYQKSDDLKSVSRFFYIVVSAKDFFGQQKLLTTCNFRGTLLAQPLLLKMKSLEQREAKSVAKKAKLEQQCQFLTALEQKLVKPAGLFKSNVPTLEEFQRLHAMTGKLFSTQSALAVIHAETGEQLISRNRAMNQLEKRPSVKILTNLFHNYLKPHMTKKPIADAATEEAEDYGSIPTPRCTIL